MFQVLHLESSFQHFIINHGGSHWCKELPLKELLLPRTCAFMNIASSQRRENTTGLQYAGHPGKHSGITPGCIFLCYGYFLSQKTNLGVFCAPVHTLWHHHHENNAPGGRAHPQVYYVQTWSKSDWRFQRYWHFCITPLLKISPILTIIS